MHPLRRGFEGHAAQGSPTRPGRLGPGRSAPHRTREALRRSWWLPLLVALATFAAFQPSLQNGFTKWDDPVYVTGNSSIHTLDARTIREAFTGSFFGNYHPLTVLSLALDYRIGGLDPRGYHRTNVLLHVVNAVLVFLFFFLLTGSGGTAAIAALFFGVHPMHVESVAWVSARKDVLYVLFYLAACVSYLGWARASRPWAYAATLLFFLLSLLSKGMAVTLPLALVAIDFYLKRPWRIVEKIPFLALSVVFGIMAVVAQRSSGAIGGGLEHPWIERLLVASYGLLFYLVKAVAPVGLSAFYPYPSGRWPMTLWVAPLLVLLLGLLVLRSLRHGRGIAFGAIVYLVSLLPVLQLVPVGEAIVADRYTYLPYAGVGLILAILVLRLPRTPAIALLALLLVPAILATRARCAVWKDNVTLWSDVIRKHPDVAMAYTNRAKTYKEEREFARASADLERALALRPNDPGALINRGNLFYLEGDPGRALADLDRAIETDGRLADAWNSRGAVRSSLGRHEEALADFDRAIALQKSFAEAYLNRANTLVAIGRIDAAFADFNTYVLAEPDDPRGYFCRGIARAASGDAAGAAEDYGQAIRLEPRFAYAWYLRSRASQTLGRNDLALRDALTARGLGLPLSVAYLDSLRGK